MTLQERRKRPLILMIEDDQDAWAVYGKILNYNGYDVTCVDTGEEGARVAQTDEPDLILLDLGLPDVDGVDVLRMLRESGLSGVPVVALTARSAEHSTVRAAGAAFARYLQKPVRPYQVLEVVESMIGRAPASGVGRVPQFRTICARYGVAHADDDGSRSGCSDRDLATEPPLQ